MYDDSIRNIEWEQYNETLIDPVPLAFTLLMGFLLLFLPRGRAALPIVLVACLIPTMQRIVIATLDFPMLRVLLIFGWARVMLKGEYRHLKLNTLDWLICAWLVVGTVTHVARIGTFSAVNYRLGFCYDALGTYFLVRILLRTPSDVVSAVRHLAWTGIIMAGFMGIEYFHGRNLFAVFGGVPELTVVHTTVVDGITRGARLRCQGAFAHAIMAGSFGATLAPLLVGLWLGQKKQRLTAGVGFVGATLIVVFSSSSGPLAGWLAGVGCWALWRLRRQEMRMLRIGAVMLIAVLHFIREKPVWQLIGRASDLMGGQGYHRYHLIDAFIRNVRQWALVGTNGMAHWGWGLQDVTNEYVLAGVTGGLATLVALIAILVRCFSYVGRSIRLLKSGALRMAASERRWIQFLVFGLGASMTAHCFSFMSVSYFGQMRILFYVELAMIGSIYCALQRAKRRARPPAMAAEIELG